MPASHETIRRLKLRERRVGACLAMAVAASIMGCDGDGRVGPCVHTYLEPLLQVVAAHDAQTGTPIPGVVIRNVRRDGIGQDLQTLLAGPKYGVEVQGDSLVCSVPCGFATSEGNYILAVSAPGYPSQDRGYDAKYRVSRGGCPSYSDGGVRITLALRRGG